MWLIVTACLWDIIGPCHQYYIDVAYCHRHSSVVCLSVCPNHDPCINSWIDQDVLWNVDLGRVKEPCIIWGGGSASLCKWAILKRKMATHCKVQRLSEVCKTGCTNWDAVWDIELGGSREPHWCHMANTVELSVCGSDAAALCQITLTACFIWRFYYWQDVHSAYILVHKLLSRWFWGFSPCRIDMLHWLGWSGGVNLHQVSPKWYRGGVLCLKNCKFYPILKYKHTAGAYTLHNFYEIFEFYRLLHASLIVVLAIQIRKICSKGSEVIAV